MSESVPIGWFRALLGDLRCEKIPETFLCFQIVASLCALCLRDWIWDSVKHLKGPPA
jgi:hypothetical protein